MKAIFAAAALPIMVMVGVLDAAKLVTYTWLARHWRFRPLLLRAPLTVMVPGQPGIRHVYDYLMLPDEDVSVS